MISVAITGLICVAFVGSLVLVLRHLAFVRITSGETAVLGGRIDALKAELATLTSTVNIINNRQR